MTLMDDSSMAAGNWQPNLEDVGFGSLFDLLPDGVIVVGRDGRIIISNPASTEMFGYSHDELAGAPVDGLLPELLRDGHSSHRARFHHDPKTRPMGVGRELFGKHRDGSEFPVEISLSPLTNEGRMLVTAIIRDISDRKANELKLRQTAESLEQRSVQLEAANRELGSFTYSVSHDLRAPLRGIDGFSQALIEDCDDVLDKRGKRYLRHVRESAQEMGNLIDDLLQLSRMTRGELRRTETNLSDLVRDVARSLEASDPDRNVEWQIDECALVLADERLLRIALENLIGNAWKFTGNREHARIRFGERCRHDKSEYFVEDNGAGFDMAYVHKLFGPFQRLHATTEFEGTGIGLATVQRIVHRHGGQVWAEGVVDEGATFAFTLDGQAD